MRRLKVCIEYVGTGVKLLETNTKKASPLLPSIILRRLTCKTENAFLNSRGLKPLVKSLRDVKADSMNRLINDLAVDRERNAGAGLDDRWNCERNLLKKMLL